ncbi:MAG: hypothetical protein Fur0044_52800 [Anaerolineae bacterium]|nr:winged helix-turn-helix transcriptional regulator [Anaerolineales bacterium]
MMKTSEQCHYNQFLSALASESRLALLERLAGREMTVTELTGATGLSQSAVSHHLAACRRKRNWTNFWCRAVFFMDCLNQRVVRSKVKCVYLFLYLV